MQPELVSFKICPFGQRPLITLLYRQIPHTLTYITPMDLPEWFGEISPLGKVPLLKVEGRVIFESAVINQYLDEISGGGLQPADPLQRALHRAWEEFASACLMDMHGLATAVTEAAHQEAVAALHKKLAYLERNLGDGPYFAGAGFSLVDTAFGPLFQRLRFLDAIAAFLDWEAIPKVAAWARTLGEMPVMKQSLPEGFEQLYRGFLGRQGEYGAKRFGA